MTDIDRFGLFALAVVILLILFISTGDMDYEDEDAGVAAPTPSDEIIVPEVIVVDEPLPGAEPSSFSGGRENFDFSEPGVSIPGAPAQEAIAMPAPARGAYTLHRVRQGESLSSIAQAYYGTSALWRTLMRANTGISPKKLRVDQLIKVPKDPSPAVGGNAHDLLGATDGTAQPQEHRVRRNDTLGAISKRYYGTTRRWRDIYLANQDRISNPDVLTVGVALLIPR